MDIYLNLCDRCRDAILEIKPNLVVNGFAQLPPLCNVCGGKVSQVVRILLTDGRVQVDERKAPVP